MKLQMVDGVVESIKQIRPIFPEKSDIEFAEWYSNKFMVTEKRVLNILEVLKQYEGFTYAPHEFKN